MYQEPTFLGGGVQVVNSTVEMADITGLQPGVTYNFTVVAFNEIGDSLPSEIVSIRTLEKGNCIMKLLISYQNTVILVAKVVCIANHEVCFCHILSSLIKTVS